MLDARDNIIAMVDEAHRSQEGDYGRKMREALPNAFLFGLTGTPINRRDSNTFVWFGSEEDQGGYLSRYTMQDSIRDGATLRLHFEPRLSKIHIDEEAINTAFAELAAEHDLTESDKITLSKRAASIEALIKAEDRVRQIAADIAEHFTTKVDPEGLKAQVVVYDKQTCVAYKAELDKYLPAEASTIVMSKSRDDPREWAQWTPGRDELEQITARFNDPADPLKIIIVTAKLLTGFDAPILYCPVPRQAAQGTHAAAGHHPHQPGLPAEQDPRPGRRLPRRVRQRGQGIQVRRERRQADHHQYRGTQGPARAGHRHGTGVLPRRGPHRRRLRGPHPGPGRHRRERQERRLRPRLQHRVPALGGHQPRPHAVSVRGRLPLAERRLRICPPVRHHRPPRLARARRQDPRPHQPARLVEVPRSDLETIILDAQVIEDLMTGKDTDIPAKEIEKHITARIARHLNNPVFVELGRRLNELRERYADSQQSSLDFLRDLLDLAKDTVAAEKRPARNPAKSRARPR